MPRRNRDHAVLARRAAVARLYCQGVVQAKIATVVHVTQQQVSSDLAAIRREWQRVMAEEFDRLKAEQLARIDAAEGAAWKGWRRSLRDAEKRTVKTDPDGTETADTTEGQAGDPRFLQIVLDCVDKRLRLLGGYPRDDAPRPTAELVICHFGPGLSLSGLHSDPPVTRGECRELPSGS
jgi:hypothetical protein